ncbi:MAG TPA: hypothetical protein VGX03_17975 [Candidatus Binatia bacterium]|jgi:hypothetical protein|nr:hypothetical protein [Candidatus Binatia bacterium]
MKRKFTAKQFTALLAEVRDHRQWAKESYQVLQTKSKALEADRSKYTPKYFDELRGEIKHTAKHNLQFYREQLHGSIAEALTERELHTHAAYLADFRTPDESVDPNDKSKEGKMLRLLADLNQNIRELNLTARITRLSDEDLADRAELAGRMQDHAAVAVCLEEARSRGKGLLTLKVQRVAESLEVPGLKEAEEFFEEAEQVLKGIDARITLVDDPQNMMAHATIRAKEITEEERSKEDAQRREREKAEQERREKEHAERKRQAEEYRKQVAA